MYEAPRRYGRSFEMVLKIGSVPNFYITWDPRQLSSTVWLSPEGTKAGFVRGGAGERHGGIVMARGQPERPPCDACQSRPHSTGHAFTGPAVTHILVEENKQILSQQNPTHSQLHHLSGVSSSISLKLVEL